LLEIFAQSRIPIAIRNPAVVTGTSVDVMQSAVVTTNCEEISVPEHAKSFQSSPGRVSKMPATHGYGFNTGKPRPFVT
jgi:hypothetical protein